MIHSFGDKLTRRVYDNEHVKGFPPELYAVAFRRLDMLRRAGTLDDLPMPPGNRLEALKGDRSGWHSIRINDQWRIIFKWIDGGADSVQIVDYHK